MFTTFPNDEVARKIATTLVENQYAACVNILSPAVSVYQWDGKVENESETPALMKTTRDGFPELEKKLIELHPYEVPEIVATPIAAGSDAYLDWVRANVGNSSQ